MSQLSPPKDNAIVTIVGTRLGLNSTVLFPSEREFATFLTTYDKEKFVIFKVEVMPPLGMSEDFVIKPKYRY